MPIIPEPPRLLYVVAKNDMCPDNLIGDLSAETDLASAVLRQARHDLRSRDPYIHAEARAFWSDHRALRFWEEVLDLRPGTLAARARRLLALVLVALTLSGCVPQRTWQQEQALRAFFEELHWEHRIGIFLPGCHTDECA